jgi:hypothetical protein
LEEFGGLGGELPMDGWGPPTKQRLDSAAAAPAVALSAALGGCKGAVPTPPWYMYCGGPREVIFSRERERERG